MTFKKFTYPTNQTAVHNHVAKLGNNSSYDISHKKALNIQIVLMRAKLHVQ